MTDTVRPPAAAWSDLADNQPGQLIRARADALYADWRGLSLFRRLRTSRSEEHAVRRNADDDLFVARQFAKLGPEWRVLHGIPAGAGLIDHVLIGPGGVFIVSSQHQANKTVWLGGDTLMVNGRRVHHVRDSQHDAAEVSAMLSRAVGFDVPVTSLVVIVGDKRFDVGQQSSDCAVRVTTPHGAVRWLRRQSVEWTDYGITRIFDLARRSTTWAVNTEASTIGVLGAPEPEPVEHPVHEDRAAS